MLLSAGQFLYQRFRLLSLTVILLLTLQCCGNVTRGKTDSLAIVLEIPQGEDSSLFWLGVEKKTISYVSHNGEVKESVWASGAKLDWELNEGERVEFRGIDAAGRVVVQGDTLVTREKRAAIPLRRVL